MVSRVSGRYAAAVASVLRLSGRDRLCCSTLEKQEAQDMCFAEDRRADRRNGRMVNVERVA